MTRTLFVVLAIISFGKMASAAPLDAFEQRCRAINGAFRANASDYQIEQVEGNPTVARCAIQTGSEVYAGGDVRSAGPYSAFKAETIAAFQAACPGQFAFSATPEAAVGESRMRVYGMLMLICKLNE